MRSIVLCVVAAALLCTSSAAQTLFTYGSLPVSKEEFLRIYQKNSLNKKADMSEPALREYLDLYSLFKMKVREAELRQLDTIPALGAELDNYRRQLARTYLTDKSVTDRLVREAYDRQKEDLHVAHILLTVPASATPADTLRIYKKIDSLYTAATRGKADFAKLAEQFSDDRATKTAGGDVGWMSGLQTIYPFENAAYSTPTGSVSKPFRTQFGYHILKTLGRRPTRGQVQVAQILVLVPKNANDSVIAVAKKRITEAQAKLKSGQKFETVVSQYSEDKFTKETGGVMQPFGGGQMVPAFEDAAFALKKKGDLSPILRTDYGFHILKLIDRLPAKPFDSVKEDIRRKVENDSRAGIARDEYFVALKKRLGFQDYPAALGELRTRLAALPDTGANAGIFKASDYRNMSSPLFRLGPNAYTQADFMTFAESLTRGRIMGNNPAVVEELYKMYVDRTINDYQEHHLEDENPEFKALMDEYRNGILLFELMDRNVWTKASRDSVGLKEFYKGKESKYTWEPGFRGAVYRFKNADALKRGQALLSASKTPADTTVYRIMNGDNTPDAVTIQRGRFEYKTFTEVPQSALVKGQMTQPKMAEDGSYTIVKVDETYSTPTPKTLDEAKGYVVAEYQDYLEKKWNSDLRAKYPVKVDETVFRSMVK